MRNCEAWRFLVDVIAIHEQFLADDKEWRAANPEPIGGEA